MITIEFYDEDHDEKFEVLRDTRHGKKGFRVLRSAYKGKMDGDNKVYDWDEWVQFYETLDEVLVAIENRDFVKGVQQF